MITLVGSGAIGSLLAARCHQLDMDYQVMLRDGSAPVRQVRGKMTLSHLNSSRVGMTHFIDRGLIILPLKAYHVVACAEQLHLSPNVCIVLLHNGMGTHEQIQETFPNNPIIVATTSWGAFKSDEKTLNVTGVGQTQAGWLQPQTGAQSFQNQFSDLLPSCSWHANIIEVLWKKLAVNAVINPLTAIHKVSNGQLLGCEYDAQIKAISAEIAKLMNQLNIKTSRDALVENCLRVMSDTADNFSSMHQDIKYKRRTENDYINGYIVAQAEQLGIDVPVNKQLWQQIKKMEA